MHHTAIAPSAHRPPPGVHSGIAALLGAPSARIALLPGTATAAWEVALSNTLSQGDRVLVVRNGPFADRLAALARLLGLEVESVAAPWGAPVSSAALTRRLGRDTGGAIRAVLLCHVETGTGAVNDVAAVRQALDEVGHGALLGVDVVASAGGMAVDLDLWRADLGVASSRLGLMQPPGTGIVALGQGARAAVGTARGPRSFFDLRDPLTGDGTALGPRALRRLAEGVATLHRAGPGAVQARVRRTAEAVRAAVAAWGMSTVAAPGTALADTVTAVALPRHVDGRAVIQTARARFGCALGAGLGSLDGRAIRIFHGGAVDGAVVLQALAVAEMALLESGARLVLGAGVAAAQARLCDGPPAGPRLHLVQRSGRPTA